MRKIFLLAFTLLVTALSAYAADLPGGGSWSYDFYTKQLTIDAETVPDYTYYEDEGGYRQTLAPWSSHATDIDEIVFTNKLKTIGKNAFCGVSATRVTFQGTNLITIKENAFYDSWLIHFDFTYVKQIDEWAFCNTNISYAYLPNIETINGAPFTNCLYMLRDPVFNDGLYFQPSIVIKSGTRDLNINGPIANYAKYAYGKQMVIMADMHHLGTQWPASVQNTVRSYFNKLVFGQRENWGYSANVTGKDIGSYWYIDENNRLIVDYWGYQMPDYTINSAPWWYLGVKAKEVHIYGAEEKAIGEYAFRSFTEITKVVFHGSSSVNDIKKYAFQGCSKLSDIRLENINQVRANAFEGCSQLTYADLSNCSYIYQEAFKGCNLSTLYFSDAIISISHRAFQNGIADNAHIYITRPTPPTTGDDVFSNVNQSTVTLHISESQGDAYNVSPWSAFNRTATGTELYGVFSGNTMTIYYDASRVSRGGYADWTASSLSTNRANVTKVVFDASVANARPKSAENWFYEFTNLTKIENIKYLNTSQMTSMHYMFADCPKLASIDLSGFNTSNVTNMEGMFGNCQALTTLNLNNFDMNKVTHVDYMFSTCVNLVSIYCDKDWSQYSMSGNGMFYNCNKLKGGKGSRYCSTCTGLGYARPDGGEGDEGYFWVAGDKGYGPEPIGALCDVSGNGDFEDVVHSQFDDSQFENGGVLSIAFFTNESMYYDLNTGDIITANQDGYVFVITINPESLDDLRGMYTLNYNEGGVITIEQGEMTAIERYDDGGTVIISLNEEETAYVAVISMNMVDGGYITGVVDGLCGGSIPSTPKYKVHVSGGYGEPYDTNGHTAIVESYAIFLQRDVYFEETEGTELSINVRNIDEGWEFDHWTVNGENAGTTRPLSYTISDEEAFIVAHYRSSASYYTVFVTSDHGTVYDQNGTPLESYMGDPCFYADGPLSLNVTDIDEGWEFDYWLVDNQNVGSDLPYTFTPSHDNTVVVAVYKEASSGDQLEETYVCDFTTTKTKHTGYTDAWTYDDAWNVFGGQNNGGSWNYVKMGAKSANLANANPVYIANKNAFSTEVKGVKVYYANGSFTKGAQMGVNEWGVKVYSDAAYTNLLYKIPSTETISGSEETLTVYPAEGQPWSAGMFIQVYWDLENTSSTNGVLNIDKVAYLTKAGSTQDIENVLPAAGSVQKIIRNGQIFIIRDGKTYNAQGARVQ